MNHYKIGVIGGGGLNPRQITNPSGQVMRHKRTIRKELRPRRFASNPTQAKLRTIAISNAATEIPGSITSFIGVQWSLAQRILAQR